MKLPLSLAKIVHSARKASGLTQAAVAERTGVPAYLLSRIENGAITRVTVAQLKSLAPVLNLDQSVLLASDWGCQSVCRQLHARGQRVAEAMRRAGNPPSTSPPESDFEHKVSILNGRFYYRARVLEQAVRARRNAPELLLALRETWCDSKPEGLWWLTVATEGNPLQASTAELGFHHRRVCCAKGRRYTGDIERLGWELPGCGVLFPQVTLVPNAVPMRVDALVIESRGRWGVLEIDGELHDPSKDDWRAADIGLPTLRLTVADVLASDVLAKVRSWASQLPRLSD